MIKLQKNEQKILFTLKEEEGTSSVENLIEVSNLTNAAIMRTLLSLVKMKLVIMHKKKQKIVVLTTEGRQHADKGLPERRLINSILKLGGLARIDEAVEEASLDKQFINIGVGWLHKKGWASLNAQKVLRTLKVPPQGPDEKFISILNKKSQLIIDGDSKEQNDVVDTLKRRNIIEVIEKTTRELELTDAGFKLFKEGIEIIDGVSHLTPELIKSGNWRKINLRKYNVEAPVMEVWPGKRQPYRRFLDDLKRKLITLGFQEMTGPIVEFMFFNCDALYMPQDHPAREIHDIYFVENPSHGSLEGYKSYLKNVKKCHETGWDTGSEGWGYTFSLSDAQRLVLRSQGTAHSARMLINPNLDIPGKYFSISRCYRPDIVDRTHLTEFNQVEGIVIGESLSLRDLLGVLEKFAVEIAEADKVRFTPDYFPFTEPSVELSAYKEGYGWLEFGGAGIFRPEVTLPLGIVVPVIAWGLGVDRIFMMKTGITDIRDLFTSNIDWLRRQRVV